MKQWVGLIVFVMFVFGIQKSQAQYAPDADIPDSIYISAHSPHKATFYSAVIPGLGQIYNQKYWKVPILYAAFGGLIYYSNYNNFVYQKYYNGVRMKQIYGEGSEEDPFPTVPLEGLKNEKDTWRRYRDLCFISIGLLYVAQIIDADVDAHLFDYDINEDLTMRFEPVIVEPAPVASIRSNNIPLGLRCSIRF